MNELNCYSCVYKVAPESGVSYCDNLDCRFYMEKCRDIVNMPDMKDDICIYYSEEE